MDNRTITCINPDGMSVTFGSDFSPFLLNECDGIYALQSNVAISENTMTDGATYQGSTVKMRNIVLTVSMREEHMRNRDILYSLFKPKAPGTFIYSEDGVQKQIEYYVERIDIDSKKNCRPAVISLICPDPYFETPQDISVEIANWEAMFEFEFETSEEGIEFGSKSISKARTIENDYADYTGVEIIINAESEVTNPAIYHVESGEFVKVGTNANPLTLSVGDKVIITTHTNNKHVYLEKSDGTKTEINGYLDIDSEFIQLRNGKNTFGYSAKAGEEFMNIIIKFRYKYLGV